MLSFIFIRGEKYMSLFSGFLPISLQATKNVKEAVREHAEDIAKEIAREILDNHKLNEVCKDIDTIISEYDDRIHESVDARLTWDSDNIIIAYAFAGEYEPETLSEVPKTIMDYARAVAYEVWRDKITEALRKELEQLCKVKT